MRITLYVRLHMRWYQGYDPCISSSVAGYSLDIGSRGFITHRSFKVTRDELETLAWMIADLLEEDATDTITNEVPAP
jgi:hypothetical protein